MRQQDLDLLDIQSGHLVSLEETDMANDETLIVVAPEGLRTPLEDRPRQYIMQTPVEVPASTYYRRLLADGSLVLYTGTAKTAADVKPKKDKE